MNRFRVRGVLVAVALVAALGAAEAQGGMMGSPGVSSPGSGQGVAPLGQPYGYGPGAGYGMMGGFGRHGSGYGMGPGMMGVLGDHGYGMGAGMMGAFSGPLSQDASPLSTAEIQARLDAVLPQFPAGAKIADVMPFTNNVYAQVVDAQGQGLVELLVDRYSGWVTPEPGPNMMWSLQGPMASRGGYGRWGMMGGYGWSQQGAGAAAPAPRFDQAQARAAAAAFLTKYAPGASVLGGQAFDGYYTFDYGAGGVQGMLSVNAFTGEIWPHTWHGAYIGTGD